MSIFDNTDTFEVEQGSSSWKNLRGGIVTASEATKLITTKSYSKSSQMYEYAYKLAAQKVTGETLEDWGGNYWTDRGLELESEAVNWYSSKFDVDVDVDIGFAIHRDIDFGFSPDGVVRENDTLLEVKCLAPWTHVSSFDNLQKIADKYFWQCQSQIWISGAKSCDLLLYHPKLPNHIITFYLDENAFNKLFVYIKECLELRDRLVKSMSAEQERGYIQSVYVSNEGDK